MRPSEAKLIAESTGCKGCMDLATGLADNDDLSGEVIRDQQRKIRSSRAITRQERGELGQTVRGLVAEWKRTFPEFEKSAAEPGSARWKRVEAVLRGGCKPEDGRYAIHGAETSPWHQGKDHNGKRRCDINHIFTNEKMVEDLRDRALGRQVNGHDNGYDGPRGLQAVLDRLEGAKDKGEGQWEALCPAHDDRDPSLRIAQAEDRVLLTCKAGCETETVVARLGLSMSALFAPQDAPAKITTPRRLAPLPSREQLAAYQDALLASPVLLERLHAVRRWTLPTLKRLGVGWDARRKRLVFPVRDAQGELVQIVDYSPKPQNGDRKIGSLKGRPRELWPAPEGFAAEILLVEGEPDAVSGHELGMRAVAIPGCSTWKPAWPERFAGRRVLVCFDCDEEGRAAARRVFESLKPLVPYVRVVDLDVSRSDGFDVSDFLLAGGTAEQLRAPGLAVAA